MIVLVTGANGFLGRHLAKRFAANGHTVIGCGRGDWSPGQYREWGLMAWYRGSISLDLLQAITEVPDLLVHCAGSGSVIHSVRHPHKDFADTVQGTAAVLEYVRLCAPAARVIYPSSPAVQGVHDNSPILTTDPHRPVSPYGFHKMMAESLCDSYRMSYELRITIVRFFSIYGVGLRKQLLWDACGKLCAAEHEAEFWGDGHETRDWVHVDDATDLVIRIAEADCSTLPAIFNCGSGVAHTTHEILMQLRMLLGASPLVRFNGVTREGDPRYYLADISSARALDWQPRVTLEEGLRRYAEWFRGAT